MSFERDHASCRQCAARSAATGGGFVEGEERTFRRFDLESSHKHYERDRPFVIRHLACDWDLEVEHAALSGHVDLEVERIAAGASDLVLDAVAFDVRAVELKNGALPFVYDGRVLRIAMPPELSRGTVRVAYRVKPRRGMLFLAPDQHVPDRPKQVWTQCQEEDARYFLPCHDAPHVKTTSEMRVRVPRGWTALSNGQKLFEHAVGDKTELHYRFDQPHPSYLLTLVAGDFASYEEVGRSGEREIPLRYLYPHGRDEDARATFGRTAEMLAFFTERFGVGYPWQTYSQVVVADFPGGGMENTTATTLYEHTLTDPRARIDVTSDELIAHELAHQWFGNLVTCRTWSEGWLNEGFATYCERLWDFHERGEDEAAYALDRDLGAYLTESARYVRPIVCPTYDAPYDLFDRHLYEKAGVFLHVLRGTVGDEAFFRAIHLYLETHARGLVETRDLLRAMEHQSGRALGQLFDEALYLPGHPVLDIEIRHEDGLCTIDVKQLQKHSEARDGERGVPQVFHASLTFQLLEAEGSVRVERVTLDKRVDRFVFVAPVRPRAVVVDPELGVLGEIAVRAPLDMLHAQLAAAPSARGRWLAARALATLGDSRTLELLAERMADDAEFWGVRVECVAALGVTRSVDAKRSLIAALDVAHPKVRRAVARALGVFRSPEVVTALVPVALGDASLLVQAEAARSLGKTKEGSAYDTLVILLGRSSWADVVAVGAIDGLVASRDERAVEHVAARTKYGYPVRIRRAAVRAVSVLLPAARARELLEALLDDPDQNLRIEVAYALAELDDVRSRDALAQQLRRDLDPRARRAYREVLRELGRGKKPDAALQSDVSRLEKMVGELQRKLGELEARVKAPEPSNKKRTARRPS